MTPREGRHNLTHFNLDRTVITRNEAYNGINNSHLLVLEAYLEETGPGHEEQRLYAATIHLLCEPHSMNVDMIRSHCTIHALKRSLDDGVDGLHTLGFPDEEQLMLD